jgi:hypothetical protein
MTLNAAVKDDEMMMMMMAGMKMVKSEKGNFDDKHSMV